jgi:hypothetical protein
MMRTIAIVYNMAVSLYLDVDPFFDLPHLYRLEPFRCMQCL